MNNLEAKEGDIHCFYANETFLKVKQAFAIDRVCFSFVKKGTKGSGFNIYIKVDEFDALCDEILNYSLLKEINEEKQRKPAYPESYVYKTGQKGEKVIRIGAGKTNGKNAVCINGSVSTEKKNMFVASTYRELQTMAKWWKRCSKPYFDGMVSLICNAKMTKPKDEELADYTEDNEPNQVPATTLNAEHKPVTKSEPKPEQKPVTKSETEPEPKPVSTPKPTEITTPKAEQKQPKEEVKLLSIMNTGNMTELKNRTGYACKFKKGGTDIPPVVFYNSVCNGSEKFNRVRDKMINALNVPISIVCTRSSMKCSGKETEILEFVRFIE